MSDSLSRTFDALAASRSRNADLVLARGLDVDDARIQEASVAALLKRESTTGQIEIVRRLKSLPSGAVALVQQDPSRLQTGLRQCLLHGEAELIENALELVQSAEAFDQVPSLVAVLQSERKEWHGAAAQTLRTLVFRLYERLCQQPERASPDERTRYGLHQIRDGVLAALDEACSNFAATARSEDLAGCVLILGEAEHAAVKNVLFRYDPGCRESAGRLLLTSRHPGVMQVVCELMSGSYPPPRAFEAVQTREDPEFVCHLLRWFPARPSSMQARNFRQVESVAWLEPPEKADRLVPGELQASLASFVMHTGLPDEAKLGIQQWLLRHGGQQARLAAADVVGAMRGDAARSLVCENLDADDGWLQAWATGQLRSQRVPEALSLLIERLDSPKPEVREAARAELDGLRLETLLDIYDELEPGVCRRVAELLRKIDPRCLDKLRQEITGSLPGRCMRAARAAAAMQLHRELVPEILTMLESDDAAVRRVGLEVLERLPEHVAPETIAFLRDDPSPRVRATAETLLQKTAAAYADRTGDQPSSAVEGRS